MPSVPTDGAPTHTRSNGNAKAAPFEARDLKKAARDILSSRRCLRHDIAAGAGASQSASAWARSDVDGGERPDADEGPCGSCGLRIRRLGRVLWRHPLLWAVPLLLALTLAAVGAVGVVVAAREEGEDHRAIARGVAQIGSVGLVASIELVVSPLLALATNVHEDPGYKQVARWFYPTARTIMNAVPASAGIYSIQLAPQGVVTYAYPVKGNEAAIGINVLKEPTQREGALATIARGNITMNGPVRVRQGFDAVIFRLPIFLQNVTDPWETFDAPAPAYDCAPCYNASTGVRFWGFATLVVDVLKLVSNTSSSEADTRLSRLADLGYAYVLYAPLPNGSRAVLARSAAPIELTPEVVAVPVPVSQHTSAWWRLAVAPAGRRWVPPYQEPMLAVVAMASTIVASLVACIMYSRHKQTVLVGKLKKTNAELAEEKRRMDVLLARQLNLISCALGDRGLDKSGSVGPSDSVGRSRGLEEEALDKIESMRRNLAPSSSTHGDELELQELLGEGAFGKVYRGLWRGTEVAIKSMILPARMSGAEKREKMAIMEAAISSAMHHPNIVQTYTYTIKPTTASTHISADDSDIGAFSVGFNKKKKRSAVAAQDSSTATGTNSLEGGAHVHNFEVCLVLEYCDMGSLRDALDAGAFKRLDGSINYSAVLDTALDIARAMLHLHKQQVIHSDLKARNVLLKSDGTSGRGVVAKVADFGLSVRIDNHATHISEFQGTVSHMAPETQLQRRITKASDVYAFAITLWELYTGRHAFKGTPILLLAHKVSVQGMRPSFPSSTPEDYRALAEACWVPELGARPCFEEILLRLTAMRKKLGGRTATLQPYSPAPPQEDDGAEGDAGAKEASEALVHSITSVAEECEGEEHEQQQEHHHHHQQQQQLRQRGRGGVWLNGCAAPAPAAEPRSGGGSTLGPVPLPGLPPHFARPPLPRSYPGGGGGGRSGVGDEGEKEGTVVDMEQGRTLGGAGARADFPI